MFTSRHTASGSSVDLKWLWLLLPFVALLLLTVLFDSFDLDHAISDHFYRPGEGWFLAKQPLWYALYKWGTIPGILLTLGCLIGWLGSFYSSRLKAWRKPFLVVVLTAVLAAGLLVNAVLKQYWGRPRPSQTIEYGGQWEYRPIFPPGIPGQGASFPCGHCTMGFLFLATAAFYPHSRRLATGGVATGVVLGVLLSAARVVQGAHFTSDTFWSFGLVGITAAGLILWLPETKEKQVEDVESPQARAKRIWVTIATVMAILIVTSGFLTRRPFYQTRNYALELPTGVKTLNVRIDQEPERLTVHYTDQSNASLQVDAHGFGWIKFDYRQQMESQLSESLLEARRKIDVGSYFAELDHALVLTLPASRRGKLELQLNDHTVALESL